MAIDDLVRSNTANVKYNFFLRNKKGKCKMKTNKKTSTKSERNCKYTD